MSERIPPILIAFASSKGGVGKSTSCISIAGGLAKRGVPVRIIDLDQTGTLLRWYENHGAAYPMITVETVAENQLFKHLTQLVRTIEGYILVDLAGSLSTTMIDAAAFTHLTITPATLFEPDIFEALKLHHQLVEVGNNRGYGVTHRILITKAPPDRKPSILERHLYAQIAASPVKRFVAVLHHRIAFPETFTTGDPPHYASSSRDTALKSAADIDAVIDEMIDVLSEQRIQPDVAA